MSSSRPSEACPRRTASAIGIVIEILKKQQVNDRLPRYLGDGITIAHKTGDGQPWVANDAGIIWINDQPVVLVNLASHHRGTTEELSEAQARLAATIVHHYGGEVDPAGLRPVQDDGASLHWP